MNYSVSPGLTTCWEWVAAVIEHHVQHNNNTYRDDTNRASMNTEEKNWKLQGMITRLLKHYYKLV